MRKLASIQRVKAIEPIPGADSIECLSILGWKVVSQKGNFQVGDLCLFLEIDAQLSPEGPFEFLAEKNVRTSAEGRTDPVLRTMKLRGQISQGLALPVTEFPYLYSDFGRTPPEEGTDFTEALGITKWEAPVPLDNRGIRCGWPSGVPKTDEDRIQLFPNILDEYPDTWFYASLKYDGTSMTVFNDFGDLHVCSRNWSLLKGGTMWDLAEKYKLQDVLPNGWYLQGECYGEGIQGNPHKMKGQHFVAYTLGSINVVHPGRFSAKIFNRNIQQWDIPSVRVLDGFYGRAHTMESLIELADSTGLEGVVVRSAETIYDPTIGGPLSFKVISPKYLLKAK